MAVCLFEVRFFFFFLFLWPRLREMVHFFLCVQREIVPGFFLLLLHCFFFEGLFFVSDLLGS